MEELYSQIKRWTWRGKPTKKARNYWNNTFKMEKLPIRITDDGYTIIDENAKTLNCATKWKDLSDFEDFLISRLTKEKNRCLNPSRRSR